MYSDVMSLQANWFVVKIASVRIRSPTPMSSIVTMVGPVSGIAVSKGCAVSPMQRWFVRSGVPRSSCPPDTNSADAHHRFSRSLSPASRASRESSRAAPAYVVQPR